MITVALPGIAIVLLSLLSAYLYFGRLKAIDSAICEHIIALRYAASMAPYETPGRFCGLFIAGNSAGISSLYPDFTAFRVRLLAELESEAG